MPATTTTQPTHRLNGERLRLIRETWNLSQAEFAKLISKTGKDLGENVACTKRLIQHWESGDYDDPTHVYRRILTKLTGMPYTKLCAPLDEDNEPPTPLIAVNNVVALAIIDGMMHQLNGITRQLTALREQLRA